MQFVARLLLGAGLLLLPTTSTQSSYWVAARQAGYKDFQVEHWGMHARYPLRTNRALSTDKILSLMDSPSVLSREQVVLQQVEAGNVPNFMRHLSPVTFKAADRQGQSHKVRIWVSPDYFCLGTNDEFIRIPLTPMTAQLIGRKYGLSLPTKKLVDLIYRNSHRRLVPRPMPPSRSMTSPHYFASHNRAINRDINPKNPGRLIAGHKKDVVITRRLFDLPGRVAIYGWHQPNGQPIQPVSLVHGAEYVDYSHGIRFVSRVVEVDGVPQDLHSLLKNHNLWTLISDEGRFLASNAY
jgi:hypothetical protein